MSIRDRLGSARLILAAPILAAMARAVIVRGVRALSLGVVAMMAFGGAATLGGPAAMAAGNQESVAVASRAGAALTGTSLIGATIFKETGARGMVMAVIRGEISSVDGYGETRPGSGQRPDAVSLVRIGSLSKLLTSQLMVDLATDGKLRLTDPLQVHAPPGGQVPEAWAGRPITLLNLATHTSGLPRQALVPLPPDAPPPGDAARMAWPDQPTRWSWLAREGRQAVPGQAALYSNIAYDFLADALGSAAGMPFTKALTQRVTRPLLMRDTTAAPDGEQCARLMDGGGVDASGGCANMTAIAGSGGLYSTAADMTIWMRHELGLAGQDVLARAATERSIRQAMYFRPQALLRVEGLDSGGEASGIGLGWIELAGGRNRPVIIEKTGGGGGFMSYVALVPGRKVGIFVVASKFDMPALRKLANRVNDLAVELAQQQQVTQ